MSAVIDPRDVIPEPGPSFEMAVLGDFEANEHDSTFPERPQWRRYRIVHAPTGTVVMDQAIDRTSLQALLAGVVAAVAAEDPLTSDLYSDARPGLANVQQAALVIYKSAQQALGLA
ncbi:hypothetical protein [Streptomyces sp. NRRL B-24484]|uniref:hypothetical protein n=1 Tax=Streptomyces sp. NRRL B-24484 TaxID=1463833 RepID=UPI0004BEC77D|nr:hypothetical protein [Streptomyces sp. NRRL B-24484]